MIGRKVGWLEQVLGRFEKVGRRGATPGLRGPTPGADLCTRVARALMAYHLQIL